MHPDKDTLWAVVWLYVNFARLIKRCCFSIRYFGCFYNLWGNVCWPKFFFNQKKTDIASV